MFLFMLYRRMIPSVACVCVAIVGAIMGNLIVQGIIDILSVMGPVSRSVQLVIASLVSNGIFVFIALAIVIFMIVFVKSSLEYRNLSFTLEELNLKIKRGILSTIETSTPYRQIQGVEIERSVTYKIMGLSRLVINTTKEIESLHSHKADQIILEPIDAILAEEVREVLEHKIGVQIIERSDGSVPESSVTKISNL